MRTCCVGLACGTIHEALSIPNEDVVISRRLAMTDSCAELAVLQQKPMYALGSGPLERLGAD